VSYQKRYSSITLAQAPSETIDPTPMTREGTHALVERFYALKRSDGQRGQVGGGGCLGGVGFTSLSILPTQKSKRHAAYGYYGPMK